MINKINNVYSTLLKWHCIDCWMVETTLITLLPCLIVLDLQDARWKLCTGCLQMGHLAIRSRLWHVLSIISNRYKVEQHHQGESELGLPLRINEQKKSHIEKSIIIWLPETQGASYPDASDHPDMIFGLPFCLVRFEWLSCPLKTMFFPFTIQGGPHPYTFQ